jgi:hypothetical protein
MIKRAGKYAPAAPAMQMQRGNIFRNIPGNKRHSGTLPPQGVTPVVGDKHTRRILGKGMPAVFSGERKFGEGANKIIC